MQETPLLVTLDVAGRQLGCSRTTLYQLISRGELETVKVGKLRRVPVAALTEYVDRLRSRAAA